MHYRRKIFRFTAASLLLSGLVLCHHALAGGVALVKDREGQAEEFWKALTYDFRQAFTVATKFTTAGRAEGISYPNGQIGAVVDLPDFNGGSFLDSTAFGSVTAKREELERLAARCKSAAPTLLAAAAQLKAGEQRFASGDVLRNGKWLTAAEWKQAQIEQNPVAKTIPSFTVGGQTYKEARLTSFRGASVGIIHAGGVSSVQIGTLSEDQILQLNATSSVVAISKTQASDVSSKTELGTSPQVNQRADLVLPSADLTPDQKGPRRNDDIGGDPYSEKLRELQEKAESGDLRTAAMLSGIYRTGLGLPYDKNPRKAYFYAKQSAEGGNPLGQWALGFCFLQGAGVERDKERSEQCFREAVLGLLQLSLKGDVLAQSALGRAYLDGLGTEKNEAKGLEWLHKAVAQGNADAQMELAHYHFEVSARDLLHPNWREGEEWLRKAAEQGRADAQIQLADRYSSHSITVDIAQQDVADKMRKRQAAFWRGKYDAQVEGSQIRMVKRFEKPAAEGQVDAQISLGYCYLHGLGVQKDEEKARSWFTKANPQIQKDVKDPDGSKGAGPPLEIILKLEMGIGNIDDPGREVDLAALALGSLGIPGFNAKGMGGYEIMATDNVRPSLIKRGEPLLSVGEPDINIGTLIYPIRIYWANFLDSRPVIDDPAKSLDCHFFKDEFGEWKLRQKKNQ